ncbi:acetyl-CoA decarbonylase/synthase complex subunit gamma [Desulfobacca acetoxidans]|uniref:CO dehydrogenase/acetyl-CoA synthase delta subunit, TIM barrel n=1 Tax=Desulfobacca acetoxidans (strain ATCC 700848 / DSM 11109 / ASRB2) TaxID=880072 RepID=F2ND77_DESAR|nr:acetyl-CoA decarbonylase/synthase complex subunit gamma [Desulfobacca acetoxidans]AEB09801.1 CO dehydrogenase/acetyl-CoA synthase delta subunit, TIM barrel [Desulfobacca acetoxidans DSM 11109]
MALTGIAIFKMLPKTNCKECGFPTCLAFAMALASGKAELAACPYVSEEAKEKLSAASAPPIRPVKIDMKDAQITTGGETVFFRHEKTFFNPTILAGTLNSDLSDADIDAKLSAFMKMQFERVGFNLRPQMFVVKDVNGDAAKFAAVAKAIVDKSDAAIVLMSDKVEVLKAGAEAAKERKPVLYAATAANADAVGGLAKEMGLPVVAKADGYDALAELTTKLTGMGLQDIILDSGARTIKQVLQDNIAIRRAPLLAQFKPFGFPTINLPCEMTDDPMKEALYASICIAKYGGIVVLKDLDPTYIFPLLLQRLNIYTDPQRPMIVTPGIYPLNNPDENSIIAITTNFALTYFIVTGEIEGSKVPTWLLIKDTEGLSVMTAWAAGKFSGDDVGMFVKKCGIVDKAKTRSLIIPGYAAAISGDLEEELPDWKILIGPREAAHIPAFFKAQ